ECADALGLSADSAEALVALRESITDPVEYQLVCETMYRVGVDLLRQAYRSMDEDITGGSNGGTKRARKQDTEETVRPSLATPQSPFRWARHHPTPVRWLPRGPEAPCRRLFGARQHVPHHDRDP